MRGNYSVLAQGSLQVMNNVWAREKAKGAFEQCVLRRGADGQAQLGWTWAWPGFEPGGFSFPEIIFGWKPWSDGSTDARLPIQISALNELSHRYAVTTESPGKLNLTAAVWLTSSGQATAPNAFQQAVRDIANISPNDCLDANRRQPAVPGHHEFLHSMGMGHPREEIRFRKALIPGTQGGDDGFSSVMHDRNLQDAEGNIISNVNPDVSLTITLDDAGAIATLYAPPCDLGPRQNYLVQAQTTFFGGACQ